MRGSDPARRRRDRRRDAGAVRVGCLELPGLHGLVAPAPADELAAVVGLARRPASGHDARRRHEHRRQRDRAGVVIDARGTSTGSCDERTRGQSPCARRRPRRPQRGRRATTACAWGRTRPPTALHGRRHGRQQRVRLPLRRLGHDRRERARARRRHAPTRSRAERGAAARPRHRLPSFAAAHRPHPRSCAWPRRVSGYSLDWLLPEHGFDVARASWAPRAPAGWWRGDHRLVEPPAASACSCSGSPTTSRRRRPCRRS